LAFVSGSNAGSAGATLQLFAHPQALRVNGNGFVKAEYTAASGAGTGSATHVAITVNLDPTFVFDAGDSSAGCSISVNNPNDVVCNVGTVNAGATAIRIVTFTATKAGPFTINGNATQDNGTGGNGGGGGSLDSPIGAIPPGQLTVYPSTDTSHDGNCLFKPGNVHTPAPSKDDNQSTSAQVGTADPTLGIPCADAEVGEDGEGVAVGHGFSSAISHDNIAKLTTPATITITLYSLSKPFSQIVWHYIADYTSVSALNDISTYPTIAPCQGGKLPANATVPCLLSKSNQGQGATWTFLQNGTGTDPAYGH